MIASDRWSRIDGLLDEALELPSSARVAFVRDACVGNEALYRDVSRLLEASEAARDSFLQSPAVELAAPLLVEAISEPEARALVRSGHAAARLPERVGPWRVLRLLGRGGMGVVYLAERQDRRYERRVAIKRVPSGPLGPEFRTRLLLEQRILASLEHPNIARLYEVGVDEDGSPYFVMEYVRGRRIDAFCHEERLSVSARLALFEQICEAVQYAHSKLVVHRDLKPGNILVSTEGVVKLLDFGIAKLLSAESEVTAVTGLGGFRALTPEYASPEQLRGEPVSTATDVYALGVLLFELLTGVWPYRLDDRSPLSFQRAVLEQEPKRPSAAATSRGLRRQLRGDLDNVVLTALRKEPERRYPSVRDLQDDIRNHRESRPVQARPPAWGYRARKFVRRHRAGMAAAGLVTAALLAGLVATAWQARVASREAQRADRVRDFVVELFEVSDPDEARGEEITARALLDRGAERLETELSEEPVVRAEMLSVLGTIYHKLGMYDHARPLLEEALEARLARLGSRHLDVAESLGQLASLLLDQGDLERAEELARRALSVRRYRLGAEDTLVAASMSTLAAALNARGEFEEAEELHRAALETDRRHGSPRLVAMDLGNLSVTLWRLGRYEEALPLAEESVALRREVHGPEHTAVATDLINLASVLRDMGEHQRAEGMLREALAMRRRLLGDEHPQIAHALGELASLLRIDGRFDQMEEALREALAIRRAALGERNPHVAETLNQLGYVRYQLLDQAGAAAYFEQALEIWRPTLGDAHPHVLTALHNLGAVRREQGDLAGAEDALREALRLRLAALGEDHPDVGSSYNNLAIVLSRQGRHAEAEENFHAALASWRAAFGVDHPTVAYALVDLGEMLVDVGRPGDAEPFLRQGLEIRIAKLDEESTLVALARLHLGRALLGQRRFEEAEPLLLAAYPPYLSQRGEDHPRTRLARRALAELYAATGRPEEALAYSH